MEGDLGDSEESLSALIENVPGIIYRCELNENWTMRYLSDDSSKLTGYEPSDFIDDEELSWGEIIHPEDRERVWNEINDSLEKDEKFKITYRIITKEGDERWIWEQGKSIEDEEGDINLQGFITDITEEIKEHEKIEEREKKVKKLYEASTEMERCTTKEEVYELGLYYAKNILDFYAAGIFIKEKDHFVGKKFTENSVGEKGNSFPLDKGIKGLSYRNNEAILIRDVANWDETEPHQENLKSGLSVPIGEMGVLQAASKEVKYYDDFDLEMAKILASHINETIERIESEEEKSLVLETAEEHIVYLDNDLKIKWANRETADYTKFSKEELVGRKCFEAVGEHEDTCKNCPVEKVIESGNRREEIQKDEDGAYWLIRATPRFNEDGDVKGVVVIALDITQRKKAEERLQENKEKIEALLETTSRLENQRDVDGIYDVAIDAIENIVEIDLGAIFVLQEDKFVLKAQTSKTPSHDLHTRDRDDGMLAKTFDTKEPDITANFQDSENANPYWDRYNSGISLPIGDFGVFQGMSEEKDHFEEEDLNLLELLSTHVNEARKRINFHEELERSEKRYRTLFEESPISIWEEDFTDVENYLDELKEEGVEDFEGYFAENPEEIKKCTRMVKINDVNKTTLNIFGAESKEEIIENFDRIIKDEALEGFKEELLEVVNDQGSFTTSDFVNYTLDGERKYFYVKWTAIGVEDKYSKVIVSLVDISQLKETQRQLERSEKKYRSIFENTGTAMVTIEEDKTISLVNEEFAEMVGYPKEEIVGKMDWTFFVAEKDRKRMIEYHEKRREDQAEAPSNYEFTLVNRFGDARDVVIEIGMIPETKKTVASLIDITDYKKTFGALRESQEAFRILFENTNDPVFMIDEDHRIKEVNDTFRETLGYEDEKIVERTLESLMKKESGAPFKRNLKDAFEGKLEVFEKDVLFMDGEGNEVPMSVRFRLIKDHEENPLYVIGILQPE